MSVTVEKRVVGPGDDSFLETAWSLKESIRAEEDLLKQRRGFFEDAYRRSTVHLFVGDVGDWSADDSSVTHQAVDGRVGEQLIGYAAARRDGYILFLAVHPDYRGEGYGERLVGAVAEESTTVTCHARTTNQGALGFYQHLGFSIERRIGNYYEDGGAAYYLRLGDRGRLRDRLSEILRR